MSKLSRLLSPEIKVHPVTGCRVDTLFGIWAYDETHLNSMVDVAWGYVERGELKALADANNILNDIKADSSPEKTDSDEEDDKGYRVENGLGHVSMSGPITKYKTSFQSVFGGVSTMEMRNVLAQMALDDSVKGIFIHADSWGGTAEGTSELAAAVNRVSKKKKVFVHAEDKATSAMLWIATQGSRFTAGNSACVGSLGTLLVLQDSSGSVKETGRKPVVIASGKFKGIGVPGTPITTEQKAELERHVLQTNQAFADSVVSARRLDATKDKPLIDEILTARIFVGQDAQRVGLIDKVCTTAEAIEYALKNLEAGSGRTSVGFSNSGQGNDTMLTAEQLSKAKAIGISTLTAESGIDQVLTAAEGLHADNVNLHGQISDLKKKVPETISPKLAKQTATVFGKEVDVMAKAGTITAVQATALKEAVIAADGSAVEGVITADGEVMFKSDAVMKVLEGGVKADLTKVQTDAQPAPRTEPGKVEDKNKEEPVSAARQKSLRETYGLPDQKAE